MFKEEEEKLAKYKADYEQISIPSEALDQAIISGFERAKAKKRERPYKKWIVSAAVAVIFFIGFFTSVRLSPTFASYITVIPGMEKVVELIRNDKGLLTAIENEYYQEIQASDEKNGLEVVIDGVIADEQGLVLFYTLNSTAVQNNLNISKVNLKSLDDKDFDVASISYGTPHTSEDGERTYSGTIEYFFQKPLESREFQLDLEVQGDSMVENYSIPFEFTKDIQTKKTYELNESVTIDGQKITVVEATVYPLRVAVRVKMDHDNTMKLLEFQDLRLVDENGETWGKIKNGSTAMKISEDDTIYYLQSNYFKEPKELYLVFNKIQAIDKDEQFVIVDAKRQEVLSKPKGDHLRNMTINGNDIEFTLHTEEKFPYFLFSEIKDANGNRIEDSSSYSEVFDENRETKIGVTIEDLQNKQNPISMELSFYPNWIQGEAKIKIK